MTAEPQEYPHGQAIFVLGLISLAVFILGPVAWVLGARARNDMDRQRGVYTNRRKVILGRNLGMFGSFLLGLSLIVLIYT